GTLYFPAVLETYLHASLGTSHLPWRSFGPKHPGMGFLSSFRPRQEIQTGSNPEFLCNRGGWPHRSSTKSLCLIKCAIELRTEPQVPDPQLKCKQLPAGQTSPTDSKILKRRFKFICKISKLRFGRQARRAGLSCGRSNAETGRCRFRDAHDGEIQNVQAAFIDGLLEL